MALQKSLQLFFKMNKPKIIKGTLVSGLTQFLATESLLKMMQNAFCFNLKALFVIKIIEVLY